ncbi:coagulation factor XI-like [Epinephelus lanceolatus]
MIVKVYHDVDFPGANYENLFTAEYEVCQRVYTHDPSCQFFTFFNGNFTLAEYRRICHLKHLIAMPAPPKVTKLSNVVSGFSPRNCVNMALETHTQTETV